MLKSNDWNLTCRFSWCVGVETVTLGTDHLTWRGGGGRLCFFVSFRIFFSDNTRVRIYFFFPQKLTLGYMTKTLNKIIFLSSTKIRIFFSATLGIRIFLQKKPYSPPPLFKLNGRSLTENMFVKQKCAYIRKS